MAGVVFIVFGALTAWGGITGNLAAIYAALFGATDQLILRPGAGGVTPPPFIATEPIGEGEVVSGEAISSAGIPELPALPGAGETTAAPPVDSSFWDSLLKDDFGIEPGSGLPELLPG